MVVSNCNGVWSTTFQFNFSFGALNLAHATTNQSFFTIRINGLFLSLMAGHAYRFWT